MGELLKKVEPQDLLKFGLIPEFIGRLPIVSTLESLTVDALKNILTKPKNALIKQYKKLFEMDKVKLEFDDEAVEAIANKAIERKTGARGLRTIIEGIILDIMFEIPSDELADKVLITKEVVEGTEKPVIVHKRQRVRKIENPGTKSSAS